MKKDTKNLISIIDVNQNFSKVAKIVEENGEAIIIKNNKPKYIISNFENKEVALNENFAVLNVAKMILTEHANAFKELGKW